VPIDAPAANYTPVLPVINGIVNDDEVVDDVVLFSASVTCASTSTENLVVLFGNSSVGY